MITNIIDRRDRKYRWRSINAIVEATSHDNSCKDSDQAEPGKDDVVYDDIEGVSLAEAVLWAQGFPGEVTLFIYDEGRGTTPA